MDIQSHSQSGAPAAEVAGCLELPDFLVNFLLPEVPPGNLEERNCGIPKRVAALMRYFGLLIYTMVTGWFAYTQFFKYGPPMSYMWLVSVGLLVVYNVFGPLPRALRDLCCLLPGGYYRYRLKQNDCLNPGFARIFMILPTVLSTFLQVGAFYLGFFSNVVEIGVTAPIAIVHIVPNVFKLGYVMATTNLQAPNAEIKSFLHEALYTDGHDEGDRNITRRTARQKLALRIVLVMLLVWLTFGGFLTLVYILSSKFGVIWRRDSQSDSSPYYSPPNNSSPDYPSPDDGLTDP